MAHFQQQQQPLHNANYASYPTGNGAGGGAVTRCEEKEERAAAAAPSACCMQQECGEGQAQSMSKARRTESNTMHIQRERRLYVCMSTRRTVFASHRCPAEQSPLIPLVCSPNTERERVWCLASEAELLQSGAAPVKNWVRGGKLCSFLFLLHCCIYEFTLLPVVASY